MRLLALSLALVVSTACRADDPAGEGSESESGESGDGDGDVELPGWPCDPIRRLSASDPALAPALGESGSGLAIAGDLVFACREAAPLQVWSASGDALMLLSEVELAGTGCKWITAASDGRT
ncbi:MAG TPA: hypothetical protein VM869_15810, partial [Enhygromyxa sp.]|nr:hypothetical protein [Enhygromyxa sp.]